MRQDTLAALVRAGATRYVAYRYPLGDLDVELAAGRAGGGENLERGASQGVELAEAAAPAV